MNTTLPAPQSATERRAAEAALAAMVFKHAAAHAKLISTARRSLRSVMPTAVEVVYEYRTWIVISFSPSGKGYEGVVSLRADGDGVKLYFNRGKELSDPEKLLRGSASLVRFIALETASTLKQPGVERLVRQAIALNRVAFASPTAGPGPVVIQSSSSEEKVKRVPPSKKTRPKSSAPSKKRKSN